LPKTNERRQQKADNPAFFGHNTIMEIRCKKMDCTFNNGCSCRADEVCIFRRGGCGTYKGNPAKRELLRGNPDIFELADELVPSRTKDVPLVCRAGVCLFNRGGYCRANGITVIDNETRSADCATFIEK
jgi:hypothetical protein